MAGGESLAVRSVHLTAALQLGVEPDHKVTANGRPGGLDDVRPLHPNQLDKPSHENSWAVPLQTREAVADVSSEPVAVLAAQGAQSLRRS